MKAVLRPEQKFRAVLGSATPAGGPVASVFGRTGAVTAQAGDYDVSLITGAVPDARRIIAGPALTGGGPLSGDVALDANTAAIQSPWLKDIDANSFDLNNLGIQRWAPLPAGYVSGNAGLIGIANENGTLHALTDNGGSIDLESIGNGRVMISTDSVRRLVVHQNGNVGIGPSMNPAHTLDIQGDCNISGQYLVDGNPLVAITDLPDTPPPPGSKRLWYDPADGNKVKFMP